MIYEQRSSFNQPPIDRIYSVLMVIHGGWDSLIFKLLENAIYPLCQKSIICVSNQKM